MLNHHMPLLRRWLRHTASVPKGLLRYHVITLLKEKPMSGSEIMGEIEKETGGLWKPSPGSIYPLLAWLQDSGYTKELPQENGVKRYILTEQGEKFFEQQLKIREKLRKKLEFLAPFFISGFWFGSYPEKLSEIREPTRRFVRALIDLRTVLEDENLTQSALRKVGEFLNNTAEKIEEISKGLKEKDRIVAGY